ncbi:MAG: Limonene hydroxylase [Pelotomaculum sp. PtaB.Bin104]|nr:MAG: Limonene hydroxylase [Pelotomaculum sp. PtaB.Bin104]
MFTEIVCTSPAKEVTKIVKELQNEMNVCVSVVELIMDDTVSLVRNIISQTPDRIRIIISGGATLSLLAQHFPCAYFVDFFPTEYDIVLALAQVRNLEKKMGLFIAGSKSPDVVEKLSAILGIRLNVYVYNNWHDVEKHVIEARQDGCEAILGVGDRISSLVKQAGMQPIPVMIGESTIRNALTWAKCIEEIKIREKLTSEQMNAISMYSQEGIMMINQENIVTFCNPAAAKMFKSDKVGIVGSLLRDSRYGLSLFKMFNDHEKRLGFIKQVPDGSVLVNKFPIQYPKGILLTLMDISKIYSENKTQRVVAPVAKYCFDDIIHVSSEISSLIAKAKKYANTDCSVLIRGESGTGKELLAQSIHNWHKVRSKEPFIAVNCASFNDHLFNSELFGYTEGSFTGASKGGKTGLFELANGGTLFLDEIGKLKMQQQSNLLRVLQEKEVRRIGSDRVIPVDVRVIAASNEDLEELISKGSFREDLYFRINVLNLVIPPLRDRREDIPAQVGFFLKKFSEKYGKLICSLPAFVINKLSNMDWPGNSRQLEHFLERCVVLADNEKDASEIIIELLEEEYAKTFFPSKKEHRLGVDQISLSIGTLTEMNAEIVRKMRTATKLSNSELALKLGISRPTLSKLLNKKH